jgi:hypothetical protein
MAQMGRQARTGRFTLTLDRERANILKFMPEKRWQTIVRVNGALGCDVALISMDAE